MKHLQFIGLIACALFFVSCESTETAGRGNQEVKRLAAIEQERQQEQTDEAQRNLWNAQHDILTRDGNAAPYY
jgi:hypothetical protein